MKGYTIRKAGLKDIDFLSEVVIAAEKSNSDKLSYATLFDLPEEKVKELIAEMFDQEIEGCEFSLESYLVAEYDHTPVAAFAAWIEGHADAPSKILKSNLISYTFGRQAIESLKAKQDIIKEILTEREPDTLQFEYLYVSPLHRGKQLADQIIKQHELLAQQAYPELKKAQVQLFMNNANAAKVYERNGFRLAHSAKSTHPDILQYLPFNEKWILEKNYQ